MLPSSAYSPSRYFQYLSRNLDVDSRRAYSRGQPFNALFSDDLLYALLV